MRRSRVILWALLAYQAAFLGVLLPGHTRGTLTLDGRHAAGRCCCPCHGGDDDGERRPAVPSRRDREHCAVCQFAAGLTSVPPVRLTLAELGLLAVRPVPPPVAIVAADLDPTYDACGPPLSPARA